MTQSPFNLPPGPERRQLMLEQGLNLSPNDYTPDELAEQAAQAAQLLAAYDEMVAQDR